MAFNYCVRLREFVEERDIQLGARLGLGGCGQVFRALNKLDKTYVAVKFLYKKDDGKGCSERHEGEARKMGAANHTNILQPLGLLKSYRNQFIGLVLPLMTLGSLKDFQEHLRFQQNVLRDNEKWALKCVWIWQISQGMKHLHSLDPILLHLDLKPDNILVADDGTLKISDFGLARMKKVYRELPRTDDKTKEEVGGTRKYMPPEILKDPFRRPSSKFDVYSFGITLSFFLEEKSPYMSVPKGELKAYVENGGRPSLPDISGCDTRLALVSEHSQIMQLAQKCWSQSDYERPEFTEITFLLEILCHNKLQDFNTACKKVFPRIFESITHHGVEGFTGKDFEVNEDYETSITVQSPGTMSPNRESRPRFLESMHNIISTTQFIKCVKHDKTEDFYCDTCMKQCCSRCSEKNHNQKMCQVQTADKKFTEAEEDLKSYSSKLDSYFTEYKVQKLAFEKDLNATCDELSKMNPENFDKIHKKCLGILSDLNQGEEVYRSQKAKVLSFLARMAYIHRSPPSIKIKNIIQLEDEIKNFSSTQLPRLEFSTLQEILSPTSNVDVEIISIDVFSGQTLCEIQLKHNTEVVGVIRVFGCDLIVHVKDKNIWVYRGKDYVCKIRLPKLIGPTRIALLRETEEGADVIVSDCRGTMLHFATITPNWEMKCYRTHELGFCPRDMCMGTTPDTVLLTDGVKKKLCVYSPGGKEQVVVCLEDDKFDKPVSSIPVCCGYVVADCDKNQCIWVGCHGGILHTYGLGPNDSKLKTPFHIAGDSSGNVLIADWGNHRIQLISRRGKFIRHIVEEKHGILNPTRLHFHKDTLYIGHFLSENSPAVRLIYYTSLPTRKIVVKVSVIAK